MALDTRSKRASALGVAMLHLNCPGVDPDSGKGAAWRQAVGHSYNGNLLAGVGQPIMLRWGGSIWPPIGVMRWGRGW